MNWNENRETKKVRLVNFSTTQNQLSHESGECYGFEGGFTAMGERENRDRSKRGEKLATPMFGPEAHGYLHNWANAPWAKTAR